MSISLARGRENRWDEIFTVCYTVISTELESQVECEVCVSRVHSVTLCISTQVCHKDKSVPQCSVVCVWWVGLDGPPGAHQATLLFLLFRRTRGENTMKTLWVEIRTRKDHLSIAIMGKIDLT